MADRLPIQLETALFNLNKFGLKPSTDELEQLVEMDLVESADEDGWVLSRKGIEYVFRYFRKSSHG